MARRPQLPGFATIQPVLFVLMFRYVFGGSIHVPGVSYTNYLMAGIFVQTVMFSAQNTAIGMAEDLHNGLIERFRSLVMARSAVLAGRVLADALRNVFVIVLMLGVGYLVGFRVHTSAAALVAATGVLLLFGFPSSAFVSTSNMPGPLRAYAVPQPSHPRRNRSCLEAATQQSITPSRLNEARGSAAAGAIRSTGGSAEFLRADMGDAAEVCALATAVLGRSGPVGSGAQAAEEPRRRRAHPPRHGGPADGQLPEGQLPDA
jgi:hypothetical protein